MIKSIKVMLLPNDKQATKLFQNANAAKYAYNWTVALQMETFTQTGKYLPEGDTRKLFTQHKQEKPWLYEASNNAAKQAIKDCCDAFWRFIAEKMKLGYKPYSSNQIRQSQQNNRLLTRYEMCHHPKYKRKGIAKPKFYADTEKTRFSDTHVKLEMIAESKRKNRAKANWIKLAEDRRIPTDAKYTNPRVSFDGLHWWISVGIDTNQEITQLSPEGLGIDLGLKELAISSDGSRLRNINKEPAIRKLKKKQRRLQRQVSRKYQMNKEGESYRKTSNIIKSEQRLLQINQRLANIRHNYVQQETTGMVKQKPRFVCMEDLNIKGLMKNKHLARSIAEQCWGELSRQIKYKCDWNGIEYIEADRYFPSSKTCSCCGAIKKDLKLTDRTYVCEECGFTIDRDYNAALNLKKYGELKTA